MDSPAVRSVLKMLNLRFLPGIRSKKKKKGKERKKGCWELSFTVQRKTELDRVVP